MIAMSKKAFIGAIAISILLISQIGVQFVEVAKANPGLHGFPPEVIISSPSDSGVYSGSTIPVKFQVYITGYAVGGVEHLKWVYCTIAKCGASPDSWEGNSSVPLDYNGPVSLDISGNYSSVIIGLSIGKYVLSVTGQTYFSFFSGSPQKDFRSFAKEAFFTVDTPIPKISNLSIENKTYTARDISLNFTVNETPSSVWYSLDNKTEEALSANSTSFLLSLTGLSEGDHSLVVYANDTAGNLGKSDTIMFAVSLPKPTPSLPFPPSPSPTQEPTVEPSQTPDYVKIGDFAPAIILGSVILIGVAVVGALIYFKRRKG
jgi:hypothetical protein